MRHAWVSSVVIVALVGGLCLAEYAVGVTPAAAAPPSRNESSATPSQNWDTNLKGTARFTILPDFGGSAVRDNNTGLVWGQAPDTTLRLWRDTTVYCVNKNVGNTRGWRLPSVMELASLIDPSLPPPFIPGTVFTGVQLNQYWSATTTGERSVWKVNFDTGNVDISLMTEVYLSWCVRGPMNSHTYQ